MKEQKIIQALQTENAALRQQVLSLEEKVMLLLQRLEGKSVKKDSHNSHTPPSQDKAKKTKSLRGKSKRQSGGQQGHPGHTLEMVAVPDVVEELKSNYCQMCGQALPEAQQVVLSTRQVVNIPAVRPVYTEYRQYGCACPDCPHVQKASYPKGVNAPLWSSPVKVDTKKSRVSGQNV